MGFSFSPKARAEAARVKKEAAAAAAKKEEAERIKKEKEAKERAEINRLVRASKYTGGAALKVARARTRDRRLRPFHSIPCA